MKDVGAFVERLIADRLGGDSSRFDELWDLLPDLGERLRAFDDDSAWVHWRRKTFDGWYCMKEGSTWRVYFQERGGISQNRAFATEKEAVRFALKSVVTIKNAI
jgi:hypothetical protein